jgi:hypothetical protein
MPGSGLKRWLRHFVGEISVAKEAARMWRTYATLKGRSSTLDPLTVAWLQLRRQLFGLFLSRARILMMMLGADAS